jgi:hypothetical protein
MAEKLTVFWHKLAMLYKIFSVKHVITDGISSQEPMSWPSHSPDINFLDAPLWGYVKTPV